MPVATDAWVKIGAATSPSFSKDGTKIFHLRGAGLPQVWEMAADGSDARALSAHDEKVGLLRRSPTDDRLIWSIDAGGDERHQFFLREPGGAPKPLTALPKVIHDFGAWSPDGGKIAFAANERDEGFFDVLVMDLATGARTRLLEGSSILTVPAWRPDGGRLLVIEDHSSSDSRLWLLDPAGGSPIRVPAAAPTRYASVRWTPDGGALIGLTDQGGADTGGSDFMRLCRIDPLTGAAALVAEAHGRDIEAWSQTPDGALLATVENDRGYGLLRIGPPGGDRPVVAGLPHGVVGDLAWAPGGKKLAFTAQSPTSPPGIWQWEDGVARPLLQSGTAEAGIDPAGLIAPGLVEWTSFDGAKIPGWFAKPEGAPPAAGFPSVVWVHGGPASQTRANFRADMQLLLSQGFAVMMPNIRGSTGYGRAYMEADEVALRPDAMADLAAGRAWLAAQPGIDPARIGIMGQSYGGWVVLAAVTLQPELWKAAVNYYGIADFVTLLERTGPWRRDHRAREYGFPGTDDALFAEISPIHHVARVTAPLLVLHGDRDPRVPMHESDQFVAAMEARQMTVRYERFTYAGHGFIRPDHRTRVYAAVADHFLTHL